MFELVAVNLISLLRESRSRILDHTDLGEIEFERAVRAMEEWRYLPDASIWYSVCFAEGRRPLSATGVTMTP